MRANLEQSQISEVINPELVKAAAGDRNNSEFSDSLKSDLQEDEDD